MTEKKLLWTAIVAGVLAVACVEAYVSSREVTPATVLVAARDLPEGRVFQAGDVATLDMTTVPQGALTPANAALVSPTAGTRTRVALRTGSPILFADVASPADMRLSDYVPKDKRAVSITVSRSASVTNMVLPDDDVEIVVPIQSPNGQTSVERLPGTYKVIACGTRIGTASSEAPQNYDTVTLLVSPEQAERVALAMTRSKGGATLLLVGRKQ